MLQCLKFDPITNNDVNFLKPICMITVDGGGDENARYPKIVDWAIYMFTKYDFDAYFVINNAPHQSAFNRVERRMSKLSKELSGIILPHDHFDTHLDGQDNTVDEDLELKNFRYAGEVLSEVWNEVVIDGHITTTQWQYVDPEGSELDYGALSRKDVAW